LEPNAQLKTSVQCPLKQYLNSKPHCYYMFTTGSVECLHLLWPAGFASTAWERLLMTIFKVAFLALDATPHNKREMGLYFEVSPGGQMRLVKLEKLNFSDIWQTS
jgi:hypothetical protein